MAWWPAWSDQSLNINPPPPLPASNQQSCPTTCHRITKLNIVLKYPIMTKMCGSSFARAAVTVGEMGRFAESNDSLAAAHFLRSLLNYVATDCPTAVQLILTHCHNWPSCFIFWLVHHSWWTNYRLQTRIRNLGAMNLPVSIWEFQKPGITLL